MARTNPLIRREISECGVLIVNYLREHVPQLYWLRVIDTLLEMYRGRVRPNPEQGEPEHPALAYHIGRIIEYLDGTPMTNAQIIWLLERIRSALLEAWGF